MNNVESKDDNKEEISKLLIEHVFLGILLIQDNEIKFANQATADIFSTSVTDEETMALVKQFYEENNIFIEPHGAVGIKGLMDYRATTNDNTLAVTLETAHPAKFPAEVKSAIGIEPEPPQSLKEIEEKEEHMEFLGTDYEKFKSYLKERLE